MTPKEDKFFFPPEWYNHESTWLSFPHNLDTWEGNFLEKITPSYILFIKFISQSEKVNIIARDQEHSNQIWNLLKEVEGIKLDQVFIHSWGTNDSWCRDHGPSFLISKDGKLIKAIVNWGYNAWGGKYPPFELDDQIPSKVANHLGLKLYHPEIIMEGGSIEVNGIGDLITSESCLLNRNRNPEFTKNEIEQKLRSYYNVEKIHWLKEGIVGDDTDGHVDDMVRFVNETTIVACLEDNKNDENYEPLRRNWEILEKLTLSNGTIPKLVPLPMPTPVYEQDIRLPASYANFYICNKYVIVPTYRCIEDKKAIDILTSLFPKRKVIGIDSKDIIWGLGSFHCLSQQEPKS